MGLQEPRDDSSPLHAFPMGAMSQLTPSPLPPLTAALGLQTNRGFWRDRHQGAQTHLRYCEH